MSSRSPLTLCSAMLLSAAALLPAAGGPASEPLLPDVVPVEATLTNDHRVTQEDGRTLLRLGATVANIGDGPIEVRGRKRRGTMVASQVLYFPNGRSQQATIGGFEYHDAHRHWHLLQVGQYRLLSLEGEVIRTSEKISFCLIDEDREFPNLASSPRFKKYTKCDRRRKAKSLKAGVSVGWGDTYESEKDGQWIDITGLPSGSYLLQHEVNPDGILMEKTRENNTATIQVNLQL